jgi:mono/diheme cytochrome c family protein
MKRMLKQLLLAGVAPLLMAALWMDEQPSFKPYQAPVLTPPATAVPFSATTIVSPAAELQNPVPPDAASLAQGQEFFTIYCALCHGETSDKPGLVGARLKPPPPGLTPDVLKERGDTHLFRVIANGFGRMPPFKEKLAPQERWHLINFLRTRQ